MVGERKSCVDQGERTAGKNPKTPLKLEIKNFAGSLSFIVFNGFFSCCSFPLIKVETCRPGLVFMIAK